MQIIKNKIPYNLLSGQIERDLKVGEIKINKEIIFIIFLFIKLNLISRHF